MSKIITLSGNNLTLKDDVETTAIPLTNLVQFADIVNGWISAGTLTYASPTTITVASGAGLIYQKGDKLKLTQTTVKYFYIIGVADTVLTVTGGTDYTVANAAITSPFYSHVENPLGFPDWFAWTPVLTGGNADLSAYTTARFKITGKKVSFIFMASGKSFSGTIGSSIVTLPVTNVNITANNILQLIYDGAAWVGAQVGIGATALSIYKTITGGSWAANETGVYINIQHFYEI